MQFTLIVICDENGIYSLTSLNRNKKNLCYLLQAFFMAIIKMYKALTWLNNFYIFPKGPSYNLMNILESQINTQIWFGSILFMGHWDWDFQKYNAKGFWKWSIYIDILHTVHAPYLAITIFNHRLLFITQ